MSNENDPVLPEEYLFRRILNRKDYIDTSLPFLSIQPLALKPTSSDIDGLSFYREKFIGPEAVAKAGRNPTGYRVARLKAQDILNLGLTIIPRPSTIPGHCIVPELTYSYKENHGDECTQLALRLALLAAKDIVL